jgi:hypothetical protein
MHSSSGTGPVELYFERDHAFRKKKPDPATGRKRIGCAICGAGKLRPEHMGAPPSLNEGGSGMDRMTYQRIKHAWKTVLRQQVRQAGLGRHGAGLWESVHVEPQIGFPNRTRRDEGNMEWMLKKALGDVLVEEGVIIDDCFFPVRRYTMGNLDGVHSPGQSWLRLLVFRCAAVPAPQGAPKGMVAEAVGATSVRRIAR